MINDAGAEKVHCCVISQIQCIRDESSLVGWTIGFLLCPPHQTEEEAVLMRYCTALTYMLMK
jgi:hypothetical protein